jgi:phosphoserine phosphatase RsbU/P
LQLGIRTKFIGILAIASAIPLCIAIIAVWVLGHHYYQKERGIQFQSAAVFFAQSLNQVVEAPLEEFHGWVVLSDLARQVQEKDAALPLQSDAEFSAHVQTIEARRPKMSVLDAELRAILTNDISRQLMRFQTTCPLYSEILATDVRGQLIGATEKTTDYWQADEKWWQEAFQMTPGSAHLEGINFDKSAGVYSLDVAFPIFSSGDAGAPPVGVVKGVVNISPLISKIQQVLPSSHAVRQIVQDDGRILVGLFDASVVPLQEHISEEALKRLRTDRSGWMATKLIGNTEKLVGFAPIQFKGMLNTDVKLSGVRQLYVVTYDDMAAVWAPIHKQFWMLALAGTLILLTFTFVGYHIASRKIIRPIQLLRSAAQGISASAKLDAPSASTTASTTPLPSVMLDQVSRINTADEIESLAHDFVAMAKRVLRYHVQLEEELAAKTAEIQRDLQIAREFQEALMPRAYPQIPPPGTADSLRLNFHHVYKPASSVGGDFFDVLKLSDHRAGIFIADVMGHGARSALVTAILRTLLQDLTQQADEPAKFLSLLNQHFYGIIEQGSQFVFVSAFYMILDTEKAVATYASAGHPSPILADRSRRTVAPLIDHLENNPALGLFSDSVYTSFTSFIKERDLFLMFTDGVFEALNADGEEFGSQRLQQVVERNLDLDIERLTDAVVEGVNHFRGATALPDDICLVAVAVNPAKPPASKPVAAVARS